MAWIKVIDEDQAEGELKQVYSRVSGARGKVANIFKAHSLRPEVMNRHLDLYLAIMYGKSGLSRQQREMIAAVVSAVNNCNYCVVHHSEALSKYLQHEELIQSLIRDHHVREVPEKDRKMLDYAVKLTKSPDSVSQEDIEELRRAGFDDGSILDVALVTAYFNFANRVVSGLGVELESATDRVYKC